MTMMKTEQKIHINFIHRFLRIDDLNASKISFLYIEQQEHFDTMETVKDCRKNILKEQLQKKFKVCF